MCLLTVMMLPGAMGNSAAATAEKGQILVEHAATKLAELFVEVDQFSLSMFQPDPGKGVSVGDAPGSPATSAEVQECDGVASQSA